MAGALALTETSISPFLHYDIKINEDMKLIYDCIKSNKQFDSILNSFKQKLFTNDKENIFIWLFNYDYFYLIHYCLIDFFTNKCISKKNYDKIMNKIIKT